MTRIVGGTLRGRRVQVPPGERTRPTADRAREGLFNTLAGLVELPGSAFADLYAGSGAVGLEAASRGATRVLLVESATRAAATLRDNAAALGEGVAGSVSVLTTPVERLVAAEPAGGGYDVVFADPPYRLAVAAVDELLVDLVAHGWLRAAGVVAIERARRDTAPSWPRGVTFLRSRDYGEATIWYGRRS